MSYIAEKVLDMISVLSIYLVGFAVNLYIMHREYTWFFETEPDELSDEERELYDEALKYTAGLQWRFVVISIIWPIWIVIVMFLAIRIKVNKKIV